MVRSRNGFKEPLFRIPRKPQLTCSRVLYDTLLHTRCSSRETRAVHTFDTQRCPRSKVRMMSAWLLSFEHYKFLSLNTDLVNVLSSSPSEAAGIVAAENIQRGIIWIGPRRANHLHEHWVSIFLFGDTWVTHCIREMWGRETLKKKLAYKWFAIMQTHFQFTWHGLTTNEKIRMKYPWPSSEPPPVLWWLLGTPSH